MMGKRYPHMSLSGLEDDPARLDPLADVVTNPHPLPRKTGTGTDGLEIFP
jgi:hypothetical protein